MNPAILILSAALIFIVTTSWIDFRKTRQSLRDRIRQSWGKPPEQKSKQEVIDSIASCFLNHRKGHASGFVIDDITYRDLDMTIFSPVSIAPRPGSLYKLLQEPSSTWMS
jgi:hypothetical protein